MKKATVIIVNDKYNIRNFDNIIYDVTKYRQVIYTYKTKDFCIYWLGIYSSIIEVIYVVYNRKNEEILFYHEDYPIKEIYLYGIENIKDIVREDFFKLTKKHLTHRKSYNKMILFFVLFLITLFILDWIHVI